MQRRAYGSGSIFERGGTYFGKWRVGDRQIKRKLGPVRKTGTRDGLTKAMAEARLRALMLEVTPPPAARMTVEEVGRHWLTHLEALGRKRSTMRSYRSNFENQIVKRNIGAQPVDRLTREEVERFVAACRRDGLSPKSTSHCLALLQSICEYAIKQGWASDPNPCKRVDRPKRADSPEIHFLEQSEIEALLAAVPDTDFGRVQRALYLAAFMTGMRQGELLALRWMDVDWTAQRIRVRRNLRARRVRHAQEHAAVSAACRSADRLAGELDRLYQRTEYNADDDLVVRQPAHRQADERQRGPQVLPDHARGGRRSEDQVPRRAPHVRHADGRGWCADADASGVDGPPRLRDDADLRGLPARRPRSRPSQRGIWYPIDTRGPGRATGNGSFAGRFQAP